MDHSSLLRSAASTIRLLLRGPLDDTTRDIADFVASSCDAAAKGEALPPRAPEPPDLSHTGPFPARHERRPTTETRGNAGYGYRWAPDRSERLPYPAELKVLAEIWDGRMLEGITLNALADRLNARGILASRGGKWNLQKIKVQLDRLHEEPELRQIVEPYRRRAGQGRGASGASE